MNTDRLSHSDQRRAKRKKISTDIVTDFKNIDDGHVTVPELICIAVLILYCIRIYMDYIGRDPDKKYIFTNMVFQLGLLTTGINMIICYWVNRKFEMNYLRQERMFFRFWKNIDNDVEHDIVPLPNVVVNRNNETPCKVNLTIKNLHTTTPKSGSFSDFRKNR
jgi:hypothetical protein